MKTILIVEDENTLRKNIALALSNEGYNTLSAENISAAEEQYHSADLIILDITLPDGNGLEFCREVRKSSHIPIIFLTSCDEEADIVRGFDCGGDDYITKPFRLKILLSRISAVLRRCAVELPEIELTAVEQKLLEYLMTNRDRFLSREQILEHLWDSKGYFVNDNTLSVNISRLRDKLEEHGKGKIITKRGLGYKWTE